MAKKEYLVTVEAVYQQQITVRAKNQDEAEMLAAQEFNIGEAESVSIDSTSCEEA